MRLGTLLLVLTLLAAGLASADEPFTHVPLGRDAVLWQARSCVGETHWNLETCTVMTHVHRKRAERLNRSFVQMVRAYSAPVRDLRQRRAVRVVERPDEGPVRADVARGTSRRAVDATATRRRRWIRLLTPEGRKPAGWPEHLSWSRTQARFRPVFEHVELVMAGYIPDPCPEVIHYGGPPSLDATPTGYEEDPTCLPDSDSRQRFFRPKQPTMLGRVLRTLGFRV